MDTFAIVLACLGCLLLVVGTIWFVVEGFREHIGWGLAVFFLSPLSDLVFLAMHWVRAWPPFGLKLLGLAMMIGAIAASPTMRAGILEGFNKEFAASVGGGKEKVKDLSAQIQEKREEVERLEAKLAQDGAALTVEYQALAKKKAALKTDDTAAVTAFNAEAAVYQQKATALKTVKQQIDSTRQELTSLLDERSKQSVNPANNK